MNGHSSVALALAHAESSTDRFVHELADFLRFPTVGSDASHAPDMWRCAHWLAQHLKQVGCSDVRILPTAGHPLVFAATPSDPGRPVVLIYGHYDVQPTGPIGAWHTPPFLPTITGPFLIARGASDDKGQLFAHVKALESWLRAGGPPIAVKMLFEGEEEMGSPSLPGALEAHRALFAADAVIVSDSPMLGRGRPTVTTSLRGSLGFELAVRGARNDLHSGTFGGAVADPIQALCRILATLVDGEGRVGVDGFYDDVREIGPAERRLLAAAGPADRQMLRDAQATVGAGEPAFTLFENTTVRPSLTVTGIRGGHTGPGERTVLAACARADVNVRLVPHQRPHRVARLIERHVSHVAPVTVATSLRFGRATRPYQIARNHPLVQAASRACRKGFGTSAALLPMGGSVGAVPAFQDILAVPSILVGFALPDDGKHGPNERLHLPTFRSAVATSIHLMAEVA
jgi:acetylornithine deacetylase/succinyl-diaminopimelate desuccinylase-like protein